METAGGSFRSSIILDDIGDLAVQDVAESCKHIGVDAFYGTGAPFVHDLKSRISQLGKAVSGDPLFFNQFFQMDGNLSVKAKVYNAA